MTSARSTKVNTGVKRAVVNIARLLLAVTFIVSGFVKAVDPTGTALKIAEYLAVMGLPSTTALGIGDWPYTLAAVALSTLEFALGVNMLFAIRRRQTAVLMLLFMVVYTPVTLWVAIWNPVGDCGCFGDAIKLTNWQTLGKNVVLLAAAIVVNWRATDIARLISRSSQWIVTNYTVVFILIVSGWSLYYLPLFDFRPYHIGASIREGLTPPEDGDEEQMERFVSYMDFSITSNSKGEDITEDVLGYEGYTFLLISPRLERADDGRLDLLNMLYEYACEKDISFYGLTASGESAVNGWRDITGAEYDFCTADETLLRTMIRSNPGLMLLKDGRVAGKWSCNDLPDEKELDAILSGGKFREPMSPLRMVLWYIIPLVILTFTDRLWAWSKWARAVQRRNKIYNLLKRKNMREKIVAGNWKMNMNLQDGIALAKELNETLTAAKPNCTVVICTPFIHLASIASILNQEVIGLGAENCADKEKGAYTGEVSAEMVKSTGAQYVILGHSERREYYKESYETLKEKVLLALKNGLKVIFCIGESLEEREADKQNDVVKAELEGSVFNLTAEEFKNIVIAYEPIWAIGTGKTATADQAEEIHSYIRSVIADKYGKDIADQTTILYGGSCKASNAPELFAKPDIDGGLIGGASLKAADFKGIIDAF